MFSNLIKTTEVLKTNASIAPSRFPKASSDFMPYAGKKFDIFIWTPNMQNWNMFIMMRTMNLEAAKEFSSFRIFRLSSISSSSFLSYNSELRFFTWINIINCETTTIKGSIFASDSKFSL